jgi:hypothetical protein
MPAYLYGSDYIVKSEIWENGEQVSEENPVPVSVALPTTIYSGVKAVAAAGTGEALASSQALKSGVIIKAHSTNTGTIYVGPEGVTAATGFRLSAGESVFVEVDNLADVWLDCSVSGEGVSFIAGVDMFTAVLSGFDFQFASNSAYAALL